VFFAPLALASQVVLSGLRPLRPPTGNIPYTLPTERTFLLNVPPTYDDAEKYPLVLSFHGGKLISHRVAPTTRPLMPVTAGGFGEKQQRITELSDPALRIASKPFLTAYAQGVNNTDWKMTHIWKGAP
jgi:polyhydroxybutyrate depolymerase